MIKLTVKDIEVLLWLLKRRKQMKPIHQIDTMLRQSGGTEDAMQKLSEFLGDTYVKKHCSSVTHRAGAEIKFSYHTIRFISSEDDKPVVLVRAHRDGRVCIEAYYVEEDLERLERHRVFGKELPDNLFPVSFITS